MDPRGYLSFSLFISLVSLCSISSLLSSSLPLPIPSMFFAMFSLLGMHNEFFLFPFSFFQSAASRFKRRPIIDAAAYFAATAFNCRSSRRVGCASSLLRRAAAILTTWLSQKRARALIAVVERQRAIVWPLFSAPQSFRESKSIARNSSSEHRYYSLQRGILLC